LKSNMHSGAKYWQIYMLQRSVIFKTQALMVVN
jgi:hypothetical protein